MGSTASRWSGPSRSRPTTTRVRSTATPCGSWRRDRSPRRSGGAWSKSSSARAKGRGGTVVQQETILKIADNSGARSALVIRVLGGSKRRYGGLGGILLGPIQDAVPTGPIQEGDEAQAVIVRTAEENSAQD